MDDIPRIAVALPPPPEQRAICESVRARSDAITRATDSALPGIRAMRDYHSRLIADVVTGRLDVQEVAAQLPSEAGEPDQLDDVEADIDPEGREADDIGEVPTEVEV